MDAAFQELEEIASHFPTIGPASSSEPEIDAATVKRWMQLFSYTEAEARTKIIEHRADCTRLLLTDEQWDMLREWKETQGYDKEAWEYEMQRLKLGAGRVSTNANGEATKQPKRAARYLFLMEGPLSNVEAVQHIAGLDDSPTMFWGSNLNPEREGAAFCLVSAEARDKILRHLQDTRSDMQPNFVRYCPAVKDLSAFSVAPKLGLKIDPTLPKHRASSLKDLARRASPAQNEYPVWYFLYDTLADPEVLKRLLSLDSDPEYLEAKVRGGLLTTWAGKYRALVDATAGQAGAVVEGKVFLVWDAEQEHELRVYETDAYEVVRCEIEMEGGVRRGLTFRFVGES
jgi:hypothetical protein